MDVVRDSLKFTELSIKTCPQVFDFERDDHICTSGSDYTSNCFGESGGPLSGIYEDDAVLLGIASIVSKDRCISRFTRVSKYLNWIKSKIDDLH